MLGETTEIYRGAEHLLTRRAVTAEVGELVDRIKWWEWYTGVFGAGSITTRRRATRPAV